MEVAFGCTASPPRFIAPVTGTLDTAPGRRPAPLGHSMKRCARAFHETGALPLSSDAAPTTTPQESPMSSFLDRRGFLRASALTLSGSAIALMAGRDALAAKSS